MGAFTDGSAYWRKMTEGTDRKLGIDWLRTIAGALAAVSAAVLLSTLGAAGTLIGAALGSVVATVALSEWCSSRHKSCPFDWTCCFGRERLGTVRDSARGPLGDGRRGIRARGRDLYRFYLHHGSGTTVSISWHRSARGCPTEEEE